MDIFETLRTVATRQNEEGEFPSWLMADIMGIVGEPERYAGNVHLVELLVTQISNFDPYAGAGCFDTSVGAETIGATIRQILACGYNGSGSGAKMACELSDCCQFFEDNLKGMPNTAEYIKNNLCLGDYVACNRFRIYKEFGGENIPPYLDSADTEEVNKVIQCLRKKQLSEGD